MGCDIHAYVEYSDWTDQSGKPHWTCLMADIGSRDYHMFDIMAGVRGGGENQLFVTRGLPDNLSYRVSDAAYLRITNDPDQFNWEGYTSRAQAERWGEPIFEINNSEFCGHPDWHTHSWLTATELAQCIAKYILTSQHGPYSIEWDAVLAAMQALEERGARTRLVFWFDN